MAKRIKRNFIFFTITLFCIIAGFVFTALSYMTGYYSIGEMNSNSIILTIILAFIIAIANFVLTIKVRKESITAVLNCIISVLLIVSFALLIGDRVEGIGFTIVTQFDAGHGGAEACYLSFAACGAFLVGSIFKIIESFMRTESEKL